AMTAGVVEGMEATAAGAGVDRGAVLRVGRAQSRVHVTTRADAVVRITLRQELLQSARIALAAVRLINRPFVPIQAEPAQVFDRELVGAALDARAVEVFDAEDDFPAEHARQQPVDEEGARVAQVKGAGGGGSESRDAHE